MKQKLNVLEKIVQFYEDALDFALKSKAVILECLTRDIEQDTRDWYRSQLEKVNYQINNAQSFLDSYHVNYEKKPVMEPVAKVA